MQTIDQMERELDRLLTWVRAADTRVTLVLPLDTAMLGALAAVASDTCGWNTWQVIWGLLSVIPLTASLVFLALATFPRTDGPRNSLVFFGGIANRTEREFRDAVQAVDEAGYAEDLISQCHVNAVIAVKKFRWIKLSLLSVFIAAIPWFLSIYSMYQVG
ncbi:hypothetical protein HNR65_000492 [Desulfosalsimonas propionicica]|uniref:Pycsar effector protein domain-containing protein n=1 Tax=Desulfosalsimonas propionicica TaxID=332175 RepID=A0A7W0C6N7_9BACT|nr:Pycsar system effector family protein [Desulfosalsimonas propionicica]MBA2880185.1 hypothetical protein [Desulfosalsimonas propionicica]